MTCACGAKIPKRLKGQGRHKTRCERCSENERRKQARERMRRAHKRKRIEANRGL